MCPVSLTMPVAPNTTLPETSSASGGRVADAFGPSERGADRAAVRDCDDPFAVVVNREFLQRPEHALAHLLVGFAVVPAAAVLEPAAELLRKAPLDLVPGQRLPRADVDLAQALDRRRRQTVALGDRLRGLERAQQRARIDGCDLLIRERRGELGRLLPPELVQRGVGVALEAALAVPVGLAVACEKDLRHWRLG